MYGIRVVALLAVFGLLTAPAKGGELWASEDESVAVEAGGFLKTTGIGFHFRDIDMYGQDSASQQVNRLRLKTLTFLGEARLTAEYELRHTLQISGGGGGLLGAFGQVPRPRLWDPDPIEGDGFLVDNDIDRLALTLPVWKADLTLGRQAITWGSAWFWKPTDRFSPFSPMDVDADVKRGVDAARAEFFLGPVTSLDLVTTYERHEGTDREWWVHGGARFRTNVKGHDLALSAARFQQTDAAEYMAGLEYNGKIGKVGVRGEVAFNLAEDMESWDIEAVVGGDYHFSFGLTTAVEVFYNGYGTDDSDDYVTFFFDPTNPLATPAKGERIARGEAFHVGRYYTGLMLDYELNPLVHLLFSSITNLTDPSTLLIAGLQWSVLQNAKFSAGAMVPIGEKPDGLLSMPSEFGMMPIVGYGVLKVSF